MPAIPSHDRVGPGCKSSTCSDYSDYSNYSTSTAPADDSAHPPIQHYKSSGNPYGDHSWDIPQCSSRDYGEAKVSGYTLASSVSSEDPIRDLPTYHVPGDGNDAVAASPLASTPQEFAEYFPSTQALCISHDDSSLDGNMNLRLYTRARTCDGREVDLGLFYLRMHDLKHREFSLRRYCRDSGREICHSSRKCNKPFLKRPNLHRSMSSALSSLRSKSDTKAPTTLRRSLKRQDSGYDSMHEDQDKNDIEASLPKSSVSASTILLEFSNYVHLDIKRRGAKSSERHEFEYWGTRYAWKRAVIGLGKLREVSYHLYDMKSAASLAHITPIPQSSPELEEENARGGWVPPTAMMLEEAVVGGSTDLADVIVASGLMIIVDNCIRNRWHEKSGFSIPFRKIH